jgi:hypothetical protein
MTAPVLFSRFGWIAAALILALRSVQQEGPALEPAAHSRAAHRTAVPLLQP